MTDNISLHPIIAQAAQIDKRGLIVFDDIHQMPTHGEPFSTPYMTIALNL